jgi:magnesium-protoporphyrin O-methyltransferase
MPDVSYQNRRSQVEAYFDRTAADAWKKLTSDVPLGRIRQTVRQGREQMRYTLLEWLPADLTGRRILDAGCGTGMLTFEAARRGAQVVAVDLSPTLIELARERIPDDIPADRIEFLVGDMLDPKRGEFDHIVAMDSLIHYEFPDAVALIAGFAAYARQSILYTFAPRTPALALMHAVGQWFPRSDRSPAIIPVDVKQMKKTLAATPQLNAWQQSRTVRIQRGFYTSQAMELVRV